MGQKDLTQKSLESYPDVFADTVNALLYEGKQVLLPQSLQTAPTETLYPGRTGQLHNQFHDVSQYVMQGGRVRAQYTLENEMRGNSKMVLRKAGYEGAVYRGQYEKRTKDIYPVVSLVLYWGEGRWRAARSLKELFQRKLESDTAADYIDDMQLRVYDMRSLSEEVRRRFTSDMRIIVDYLAERAGYHPTDQPIFHVPAFLSMMRELSGDPEYEQLTGELEREKRVKGAVTMCELLEKYEARGMQKGMQKGVQKGEDLLASLMNSLFKDNRMEDARRVLTDREMRKKLYREYGIR